MKSRLAMIYVAGTSFPIYAKHLTAAVARKSATTNANGQAAARTVEIVRARAVLAEPTAL
jgi:hypothetical protein